MIKFIYNISQLKEVFNEICKFNLKQGYKLSFEKKKKKRSISQNKLMWLYFACIEKEFGQDKDSLHLYFKNKYLKKQIIECFDEQIVKEPTTTKLNTKEFTEYLKKIEIFARVELKINLPDPNDLQIDFFIEKYSQYL